MSDVLLNAPLMLPSPSVLTGNYRPQTAAAFVEQTLAEAKARASGSRLASPAVGQPHQKGSMEEVSALRHMASRHLGALRQSPSSPYHHQLAHQHNHPPPQRCLSTPPLRPGPLPATAPQPFLQQQPSGESSAAVAAGGSSSGAAAGLTPRNSAAGGGGPAAPQASASGLLHGRPLAIALSVPESVPAGGTAGAGAIPPEPVLCSPSGSSAHPLFSTDHHHLHHQAPAPHGGALPRLVAHADDPGAAPALTTAASAPGPAGSGSGSPCGRHSTSQPPRSQQPFPPQPQPQPHPFRLAALTSPTSRPGTSLSVQDLTLPKPGTRLSSRPPSLSLGAGPQTPDCGRSCSGGGAKAATPLLLRQSSPAPLAPWTAGAGANGGSDSPSAGSSCGGGATTSSLSGGCGGGRSPNGTRFLHTATRWAAEAAGGAAGAGGDACREGGPKVTRGMLYSVFQEIDEFDSGRLTYSAFEQAACKIGMRPPQAKRMFAQLDPESKGYATMREWLQPGVSRQMEAFTRLYVLATRDRDGKPKDFTEIRSMHMAIQMAMVKLQLRRCGRAVSLDRLVQAFAFIDRDGNGTLNAAEVEDALNSLGIFVTKEVIDTIMRTFDRDSSGGVDYYEFVKSLYPTLDQPVFHH